MADPMDIQVDSGISPQSLTLRRRLAEMMMKQGMDASPISSPWQVLARAAQGLVGGLQANDLDRREKALDADRARALMALLPGAGNMPAQPTAATGEAPKPAAATVGGLDMNLPRSMRTMNPGAMEYGPFAISQGATGSDGRYAVFPDMGAGYKAQEALLRSYMNRGKNTVSSIVERWAPRNVDNNSTDGYVNSVSKALGVRPDQPLSPEMVPQLAEAMAAYEAGRPVPRGASAVADASGAPRPATPETATATADAGAEGAGPGNPATPLAGVRIQDLMPQGFMQQSVSPQVVDPATAQRIQGLLANPATRAIGQAMLMQVIKPPTPLTPKDQAEIAFKFSQIMENQAQLPKHEADARKAVAEAKKADLESMRMKTPAQSYDQARTELNRLAAMPEKYGEFAVSRGLGQYQGRSSDSARSDPIDYIGEKISQLGGYLSSVMDGGAPASKITDEVKGAQAAISQMVRGLTGMSARQGDSNMELQNILTMVGALPQATNNKDLQDRIQQINARIANFTGQAAVAIKPEMVGQPWERGTQDAEAEAAAKRLGVSAGASREDVLRAMNSAVTGQPTQPQQEETRVIDGKTYVKRNGQWFAQ